MLDFLYIYEFKGFLQQVSGCFKYTIKFYTGVYTCVHTDNSTYSIRLSIDLLEWIIVKR